MSTLLLRFAGPVQSWGSDSKFETRRTGREPTKSGVIGLLSAALGRKRNESIEDLRMMRFGVRVDKEGELLRDYHTAKTSGGKTYVTYRYYLSDAVFLVGLESEDEKWLKSLEQAIRKPVYSLFLGRRSCVPVPPIIVGIRNARLEDALKNEPLQLSSWMKKKEMNRGHFSHRLLVDASSGGKSVGVQKDIPISFDPGNRKYGYRLAEALSSVSIDSGEIVDTDHDAMAEL